jgi:uncharacterized protein (DUF1697 family)
VAPKRQIVLLRGINVGSRNRVSMPELRRALEQAGHEEVRTYVQSGNVVLSSGRSPAQLTRACRALIAEALGVDVEVIVRTRDELAAVVERDPLGEVASDPKRYQVSFLAHALGKPALRELEALALPSERLVAIGRELYAWHPEGVARSRLWARLASPRLGVAATARNWTTVTRLLEMADA